MGRLSNVRTYVLLLIALGAFGTSMPLHAQNVLLNGGFELPGLPNGEDQSQMEVGRQWILNLLPDDVRERVVWREQFWLTD